MIVAMDGARGVPHGAGSDRSDFRAERRPRRRPNPERGVQGEALYRQAERHIDRRRRRASLRTTISQGSASRTANHAARSARTSPSSAAATSPPSDSHSSTRPARANASVKRQRPIRRMNEGWGDIRVRSGLVRRERAIRRLRGTRRFRPCASDGSAAPSSGSERTGTEPAAAERRRRRDDPVRGRSSLRRIADVAEACQRSVLHEQRLFGQIVQAADRRTVFAFRHESPNPTGRPLDPGIRAVANARHRGSDRVREQPALFQSSVP